MAIFDNIQEQATLPKVDSVQRFQDDETVRVVAVVHTWDGIKTRNTEKSGKAQPGYL